MEKLGSIIIQNLDKLLKLSRQCAWGLLFSCTAAAFLLMWFFHDKITDMYIGFTIVFGIFLFIVLARTLFCLLEIGRKVLVWFGNQVNRSWQAIAKKRQQRKRDIHYVDIIMSMEPKGAADFFNNLLYCSGIFESRINLIEYIARQKQRTPEGQMWLNDFLKELDRLLPAYKTENELLGKNV